MTKPAELDNLKRVIYLELCEINHLLSLPNPKDEEKLKVIQAVYWDFEKHLRQEELGRLEEYNEMLTKAFDKYGIKY